MSNLPSPAKSRPLIGLMVEPPCRWKLHIDLTYPRRQSWETECGNNHAFTDADLDEVVTPQREGFQFCPYCGRKLKVKRGR